MKIRTIICITILTVISSCEFPQNYFKDEPECTSDTTGDLVLERQKVLISALLDKKPEDYRYFFKSFVGDNSTDYMVVNFRNDSFCFDIKMEVSNWNKLEGMKRTNGQAYPNELFDLKWEVVDDGESKKVRFVDMREIID